MAKLFYTKLKITVITNVQYFQRHKISERKQRMARLFRSLPGSVRLINAGKELGSCKWNKVSISYKHLLLTEVHKIKTELKCSFE